MTLDRTQWLTPAEIEEGQCSQLRALLDHCERHVPYYRRQLATHGLDPREIRTLDHLRRIPVMSRIAWQEHFDELQAEQLPPGTVAVDEDRTSGTSGVPIRVLKTSTFYTWWLAFYLRDLEWCGLQPRGAMASIRATLATDDELDRLMHGNRMNCWNAILDALIEMGPLYGMEIRQDPRRQLDWLEEVNPDYLLSHASNLDLLARLLEDEPRKFPRLRVIQAISETLSIDAQHRIESAFQAPVKNLYSCAEAGYLASPCPSGDGLHVHAENAIVEILDDAGRPCLPGETGSVVLTVLHNLQTPLVRYEIGDLATLAAEPCRCGRGLPLLSHVQGKARPHFLVAGGRRKHSSELTHSITEVGGHRQHQVVQMAHDRLVVRIVPNRDWTMEHEPRLIAAVQEFFEWTVPVEFELVDRIPPLPGGKVQSMISHA